MESDICLVKNMFSQIISFTNGNLYPHLFFVLFLKKINYPMNKETKSNSKQYLKINGPVLRHTIKTETEIWKFAVSHSTGFYFPEIAWYPMTNPWN